MSNRDLNRAVARQTGEAVDAVERHGFQLVEPPSTRGSGRSERERIAPSRVDPLPSHDEDLAEDQPGVPA